MVPADPLTGPEPVIPKPARRGFTAAAAAHAYLTPGKVIRMLRELKGWTRAQLGAAFDIHPAIIRFPEHEAEAIRRVA